MRAIIMLLPVLLFVLSCGTASSSTLYVPDTYGTIQAAVDNATAGDTIVIKNGTYLENVVVNKSITITSESGPEHTIINASNPAMHTFNITTSNVSVRGLTIEGARAYLAAGVYLVYVENCTIEDCVLRNNLRGIYIKGGGYHSISHNCIESNSVAGIYMYSSSHNTITDSYMGSNGIGVYMSYSTYNTLHNNTIQQGDAEGIYLSHFSHHNTIANCTMLNNSGEGEVYLYQSDYNTIANCTLMSNNTSYGGGRGIFMYGADGCTITGSRIVCNYLGIYLYSGCDGNIIYNNILNNSGYNAYVSDARPNSWNITKTPGRNIVGGPYLGGNYWSDYNGTDTNGDGLGDTPYTVAGLNVDYHPLTGPVPPSPPIVHFHTLHEINNVGVPVRFVSDSYDPDGTIVSWTWDFGDGTNATGENVSHTYSAYRWNASNSTYIPYSVRLTVVDNSSANNTTTRSVMVYMAGDANGDGRVNILDATLVGLHWNAHRGTAGYHDGADLNNDDVVNILDAAVVGLNWNKQA